MSISLSNIDIEKLLDDELNINAEKHDVAVIGMAFQFPKASSLKELWANIVNQVDCIDELPKHRHLYVSEYLKTQNITDYQISEGGFINDYDNFDHDFFEIPKGEAEIIDPHLRLFYQSFITVIEDAGYSLKSIRNKNVGFFIGFSSAITSHYLSLVDTVRPDKSLMAQLLNRIPFIAARLSHLYNLEGPVMCLDATCASILSSIHYACKSVQSGETELAVVGGSRLNFLPVIKTRDSEFLGDAILSTDFRTRSFDKFGKGTTVGEGVGCFLLKRLDNSIRDKDHIYAIIKGSAVNHDGTSISLTAPNPISQAKVLRRAWENAGIDPLTIRYIEAHGSATQLGDAVEIEGLNRAFKAYSNKKSLCAVSSIKANIGHLDNMAGFAGVVKGIAALQNKIIPAATNFSIPNPNIEFNNSSVYVATENQVWDALPGAPRRCGVSSFGLDGSNAHVVLEESNISYPGKKEEILHQHFLFKLSAKSESSLKLMLESYINSFENGNISRSVNDICGTSLICRDDYQFRLLMIVDSLQMLRNQVELSYVFFDRLKSNGISGVFFTNTTKPAEFSTSSECFMVQYENLFSDNVLNVCDNYLRGNEVDWSKLGLSFNKVSIPTYQFNRINCALSLDKINAIMNRKECRVTTKKKPDYELSGRTTEDYSAIEVDIADALHFVLGWSKIDLQENIFDRGANSLKILNLVALLKNKYYIKLNHFFENPTVESLAKAIQESKISWESRVKTYLELIEQDSEKNKRLAKYIEEAPEIIENYQQNYVTFKSPDLTTKLSGQSFLFTGATGFLGSFLLNRLLKDSDAIYYLIVRGENVDDATQRMISKWKYYFKNKEIEDYISQKRVFVLHGDLTHNKIGLSIDVFNDLANKTNGVIHVAALARHFGKYEEFINQNVDATTHLLAFANSGNKKTFHYMSTMGVLEGDYKEDFKVVTEFDFDNGQVLNNYYTKTKFMAEKKVYEFCSKENLNFKVYRLGNVSPDSTNGQFQENVDQNTIALLIKSYIRLKKVPPDLHMEYSSVNLMVDALAKLILINNCYNTTFHLENPNYMPLSNMLLDPALDLDIESLGINDYLEFLKNNLGNPQYQDSIDLLLSLSDDPDYKVRTKFKYLSGYTEHILQQLGFSWPVPSLRDITLMIDHFRDVQFI